MSKKHGKSTGLNVMRADIQDVWINDKSKSDYLLVFFLDPLQWSYHNPRVITVTQGLS